MSNVIPTFTPREVVVRKQAFTGATITLTREEFVFLWHVLNCAYEDTQANYVTTAGLDYDKYKTISQRLWCDLDRVKCIGDGIDVGKNSL